MGMNRNVSVSFEPQELGTATNPRRVSRFHSIMGSGLNTFPVQLNDIEKRLPEGAEKANVWVGSVQFLQAPVMVFVRLSHGILLDTVSEVRMPVRFIFILMGPTSRYMFSEDYVEIGRALSTLMSYKAFQNACYVANDPKDLILPMNAFLSGSVVVPAHGWNKTNVVQMLEDIRVKMIAVDKQRKRRKQGELKDRRKSDVEDEDDELERSGCLGLGLIRDMKRRYPLYLSDIKDGINFQCLSVIMFIFFAALSPAVTFGADIEQNRVNGWIGVTETIIGSAFMGALFALFSGQPLLIIGPTGPLAVFEGSLYDVGKRVSEENYMAFRCWVGLWLFVICALTALLELSFVLKYFTRFTEEIFSMLVSLIYLVSVVNNLITIFEENPLKLPQCVNLTANTSFVDTCLANNYDDASLCNPLGVMSSSGSEYCCDLSENSNTPNTALLSLILTVGCFIIAYFLKKFRFSPFLSKRARQTLGDFGVPIAILTMTILDVLLNDKTITKKLFFPKGFKPTKNQGSSEYRRDWFISPFSLSSDYWWLALVAVVPAFLVFFLIFIEIQITGRIISKKENNLKKGTGFHLNIFVVGISGIVCGVFGAPWVTGATVRSVSHTTACTISDSHHAPGEKPKLSVREQRVTSFMVNVLLGLVILLKPVLKYVPYAVLYGIFVYMGVSCLGSLQIYERMKLIFMPRKNYPSVAYARDVSRRKMIVFTLIQLVIVGVLWGVKESPASIAFPFFLIMLVPFRLKVLPFFYTKSDLNALDNAAADVSSISDDLHLELTASMPY